MTYEQRWGHPRTRKAYKRHMMREQKRIEAEARNAKWAKLTRDEKWDALNWRPGKCAKQRAKLA